MAQPLLDPAPLIQGFLAQTREYAVIVLDLQGRVCGWLSAAEEVFGHPAAEMLGRDASELFTAEDRHKGLDLLELEIARRDSRSEDDRWHVRRDGSRVWVSGAVHAVRDAAGQVTGFVKLVRDRTDLRQQVDQLQGQLAASEAALERTRAFLRTLGHELRNPLSPLQGAATILQRTSTDPRAERAVQILFNQVDSLKRMADDLMEVSRLDTGQVELHRERVDLRDHAQQAVTGFQEAAAAKGLALSAVLPDGPLMVDIDRARFHQAVSNLLSNAIKYTPAGGQVWVKATQEGHDVLLRIEDTGMGIGPDMLPKLFDLFARAASAQEAAPGGLGIGLSVVREVVQLHGGTVQARSPGAGKGSEFTVRLPAADAGPENHP